MQNVLAIPARAETKFCGNAGFETWRSNNVWQCEHQNYNLLGGVVSVCPPGKYKSNTSDERCAPCPEHSKATDYGLKECKCNPGYHRSPNDPKSMPCTRESN